MAQPADPLPDPLLRAILWVMIGDVLLGALLVVAGEFLWPSRPLQYLGAGLAVTGALLYHFFRWLGRRRGGSPLL